MNYNGSIMKFLSVLWLVSMCSMKTQGETHWMVTESGLIQPQADSPFEMENPHDLVAFLNQNTRWDNIVNLYHDLSERQAEISEMWRIVETGTKEMVDLSEDDSCVKGAPLNSLNWYTYQELMDETIRRKVPKDEIMMYHPSYRQDTDVPDCKKISSLTFSMFAFEHLEGLIHRENLTGSPELMVPSLFSTMMNPEQFGHWTNNMLRKNSTSWLHYSLAGMFWRTRGNSPKSIECSRRAIHYAPRYYKDIALLGLGATLLLGRRHDDAITVLTAAVDHDPRSPINHFALANAYAIAGKYNSSLKHYDLSMKYGPEISILKTHKQGVLCHYQLMKKIHPIKDVLSKLRGELGEYNDRESIWLKSQTSFLRTMKQKPDFDHRNVDKNCEIMSELTGLNIKTLKKEGDKNYLIQYFLDGPLANEHWKNERGIHGIEWLFSLQRLVQHIRKHADSLPNFSRTNDGKLNNVLILKEIGPTPMFPELFLHNGLSFLDDKEIKVNPPPMDVPSSGTDKESDTDSGSVLYPPSMKINRNFEDFDRDPDWPSNKLCKETATNVPENLEAIYPVFMPFENKGLSLQSLLTDKIGVSVNEEHEVPWHPPICTQDKTSTSSNKKSQKQQISTEVQHTPYLRQKLLQYVDEDTDAVKRMQDTEIGQRIYAVMQTKLAPKWQVFTLASLYWRVRGNNVNALNCLMAASKTVENKYRDLVLASLASVYLEMGYFDEALVSAESAFRISLYEPATNFILAELNMLKKHRNTHMFHLKQVVRVEPHFMGGLARSLLNGWSCMLKQINSVQELDFGEGDICTQVEPGMSMVCEKDGTNCHVTNIQCFSNQERESSTIVRMLELKDDSIQRSSADQMDDSIFDVFIDNMPADRSEMDAHKRNYDTMVNVINKGLQGCGPRGCSDIQPDDLALKDEDCTYQHLQLGYWLHIISFRQLLTDANLQLPSEITAMSPSSKKIPECRLLSDPSEDFFLEQLNKVDTEGWEPVLSLMHQFAEVFNFYDYVTLGAKISKYVDSKPRSWVGAVAAAWWCGAGGRGACAVRCAAAAFSLAPAHLANHALRPLAALLHMQSKQKDAKDIAYLSFYIQPKSKIEAFLVAVSHTYMSEYEQAVWMYRYALTFDDKFLPAKACLHATMCLMLFGETGKAKLKDD